MKSGSSFKTSSRWGWGIFLFILCIATPAFAKIQQWDFKNPEEYQYDAQKLEVQEGIVRLKKQLPYQDQASASFENGQFVAGTWAAHGALELTPQSIQSQPAKFLPVPAGDKTPGLMALWHLDEPSGTNLLDVVGRNVAKASDSEVVSGQAGFSYARLFDGVKSHIFIPQYETMNFDGPFSIEAWIRPVSAQSGKEQTIVSRWQTIGAQKGFALQISPEGKVDFLVSADGATVSRQTGETLLAPGLWYHIAAVYTGSDLRVYLNGTPDSQPTPFRGPIKQSGNPLYLGALVDNKLEKFFEGVIDEVAIYSRAVTEPEIMAHFGNPQALVAQWPLNESAGILGDLSGYGHNLTARENPAYGSEGKLGTAVFFDGKKQYLDTVPSSRFAPDGSLTLEAWVNPASLPEDERRAAIIASYGGGTDYMMALGRGGRVHAYAPSLEPGEAISQQMLNPKTWSHVAVSWGSNEVRIFINGVLDSATRYQGFLKSQKSGIRIGMDAVGAAPFHGAIDEPSVYRRVKSPSEIAQMTNLFPPQGIYQSAVKDAGAVAPWRSLSWQEPFRQGDGVSNEEKGIINLYHLDETETAGLKDFKGEAPLNPMGTYPVPGVLNTARWFAKPGYDKLISQTQFPALSTFTVSLWFQFSSSEPGAYDRLFSIGDENPTLYRAVPDGRIHVAASGAKKIVSASKVLNTQWHHLALSCDGRNLTLFIDGSLEGSSPFIGATAAEPMVLGNLKSIDTFSGALDEVAIYNYGLTEDEIRKQFLSAKVDAKFLVRSSEVESMEGTPWRGPRGANYIEREAGASVAGLWHLNELNLRGQAGEVTDASRFANHGTAYGHVSSTADSVLGRGVEFNGAGDYIEIADAESLRPGEELTVSAWIKPSAIQQEGARILDKRFYRGAPSFSSYSLEVLPGNRLGLRLGHGGGFHLASTDQDGAIPAGKWTHVAAVYNGKEIRLFINGKLHKSSPYREKIVYDFGSLYLGRYGSAEGSYFSGVLDEVGIDSKALTDDEVYGLFIKADPENYYRLAGTNKLDVAPGRYFQYQAHLLTSSPAVSPSVQTVEVLGNDYAGDKPFITNKVSVSYADISQFKEITGPNHQGAISYQISKDGTNWFFHNGRNWVVASSAVESNTGAQVAERISDAAQQLGIGSFYFKAFFHSPNGIEQSELKAVELEYLPNKLTVTAPNGSEPWLVGSDQLIEWNSTGEVLHVSLEYSKDDFKTDFHSIASSIPNKGSLSWKIPDDPSPAVKIRVMDALDPRIHDTSDLSFRIVGAFEVVAPNWNEQWEVGSVQKITWRSLGNMTDVKIDYSTDEFEKEIYPIVDSVKNEGEYQWTVPDHLSKTVKVRISDVRDPLTFDQSNDTFAITGRLVVSSPEANSRYAVGTELPIRWKSIGTLGTVRIEYQTSADVQEAKPWRVIEEVYANRGSYVWKVPDTIDSEVKVRISDPNDPKNYIESGLFAITGAFKLVTPVGQENWTVGSRRKIAWESVGTVPTVTLEYAVLEPELAMAIDKDPAQVAQIKWETLEENLSNTGSFIWEVPDLVSSHVLVRVIDSKDPFVSAVSAGVFNVVPGFILKSPEAGQPLRIGTDVDIVWETKGSIPNVKLEYSKDGFKEDVHEIIGRASNIERFSWTVPDDPAGQVWVRVSDPNFAAAQDINDEPFRIHGDFQWMAPGGGEKFESGSLASLEWKTNGTIPKVKIEYSHDGFVKDARMVTESLDNTGQYSWTVPDDIGAGYSLRISDARDPLASSMTPDNFSIVGKFYLLHPAGGENFTVGTTQKITWKGAGSIPVVRIDFSEDDFKKSFQTIADAAPNNGSLDWEVPNRIGHAFKLRIWDPANPESMFVMDESSRIVGGFTIASPNGGEVVYVGDAFDVQWKTYGNVDKVKIEFSNDGFSKNVWLIADAYQNLDQYSWKVPDTASDQYRIRISDAKDPNAYDISNSDFRIRSRFVLVSPRGGEGWKVGEKRKIEWQTSGNVSHVHLEYSNDDFASVVTIEEAIPNTGIYEWTVPNQVSVNTRVRVSDVKDPGAYASSASTLRIQGIMQMTSPAGGEVWRVGQSYPITWTTTGDVKAIKIEFSRDGFQSEAETLIASTANTGHYNWTVPDAVTANAKIRIVDLNDESVIGIPDKPFQIAPSFMVMAPNGGESWHMMEKREVTWVTVGTVPEVDLLFCEFPDGASQDLPCPAEHALVIDRRVLNAGVYSWDIPKVQGRNFRLQVCDSRHPEICDVSDKAFTLTSPFEIVYPRSSESWQAGSDQEIRWHTYGNVPRVKVEYAVLQDGDTLIAHQAPVIWKVLAEELTNEGHLFFKVPDDLSQNVYFKVSDWYDGELAAYSPSPVQFTGAFTLLTPNGGERWSAGETRLISWQTLGSVSNVRIEYSTDNFERDVRLIESAFSNTGSYQWILPAEIADLVKVRVADASNLRVFDVSDNPFKIMASFVLLLPDGGETWKAGTKQMLQWKTLGRVENVKLEYRNTAVQDPGDGTGNTDAAWLMIANGIPNGGQFEWNIASDVASQKGTMIRVSDAKDADAFDISNAPLNIFADFQITKPNSGEVLTVGQGFPIEWNTSGKVPSVKLEFAVSAKETAEAPPAFQPIENLWANKGTYFWTVPDAISENVWLRVSDASVPEAYEVSEVPFKIRGVLKLGLAGDRLNWPVGSTQTLTWDTLGSIPAVNLEYRLADKTTWKTIAAGLHNAGTYGWVIPDDVAKDVRIRVTDTRNPYIFHESSQPISIAAHFEILSPKAGEVLPVGTEYKIMWDQLGQVENVMLEYQSGNAWEPIAGPIPNSKSFIWKVPDAISPFVKIRVMDVNNYEAYSISETFKISGILKLISPAEADIWKVGSTQTISWTTTGSIPRVRLDYLVETETVDAALPGTAVFTIKEDLLNQGSFSWVIPDKISDRVRIRVTDIRDAAAQSVSDKPFSIIGAFDLISPKGGENWIVDSTQEIAWAALGTMDKVNLEFSRDGFQKDVQLIAADVPNTGVHVWKIPDAIADNVHLRIYDSRDLRTAQVSAAPLKISGAFIFTAPGTGEIWPVGVTNFITWETIGTVSKVRLEYSRDDFQKDIQVIENSVENSGSYEWKVPDAISSSLKFRLTSAEDPMTAAVTQPIKVVGVIAMKKPDAPKTLQVLGRETLVWETSGTIPKVRIDYSRDNFNEDVHSIAAETENTGFYEWTIPDDIGKDVSVRISDVRNPAVFDLAPPIEIQGVLSLLAPSDQARWAVGSKREVAWNTLGSIPLVKIEYSKDDFYQDIRLIADALENTGKFIWTVPDDISDRVKIRITDTRDSEVFSVFEQPIRIVGTISVTEPPAKSVLLTGQDHMIRWKTRGTIPAVRIEYSASQPLAAEDAVRWKLITGSVENTGSYAWKVPDDISDRVLVRVSDVHDAEVYGTSPEPFSILGALNVLSPQGGERWIAGTEHEIVWTTDGTIGEVNLDFSRDHFTQDIQTIAANIPNKGRFTWTVPDALTDRGEIRIQAAADTRMEGMTRSPISIIGDFIIMNPQDVQRWKVGSEQKIEWETIGTVPEIRLEYSVPQTIEGEEPVYQVITEKSPNQGFYSWRIPDDIGNGVRIRLANAKDPATHVISSAEVKIEGEFRIQNPKAGEFMTVGQLYRLKWETLGTMPRVALEYSRDGFQQEVIPIEKDIANENQFFWQVPDAIASEVQVRVRSLDDPDVFALSERFIIRGALELYQPSGDKVMRVGEIRRLEWQTIGTVPLINLEYSRDGFKDDFQTIQTGLENTGSYSWTVADAIAPEVFIRISDAKDPSVTSIHEVPFKIQGSLTLMAPAGHEQWVVGSRQMIQWQSSGSIPSVTLEYSYDEFNRNVVPLAAAIPNSGSMEWTVPDFIRDKVWIRIYDSADASVSAQTAAPFKIQGELQLLTSSEEEEWVVGKTGTIEWNAVGSIPQVRIEYSTDEFQKDIQTLYDAAPNQGNIQWVIPDSISEHVRLRIMDAKDPLVVSYARKTSRIRGELVMITPAGNENWIVGKEQALQWKSSGSIPAVAIEYSFDGFQKDVRPIEKLRQNENRYLWKVPDAIGQKAQLRVRDAADEKVTAVSQPFNILGEIKVLRPAGTDIWTVGSEQVIQWESTGTIPQVSLEYSSDKFQNDIRFIEKVAKTSSTPIESFRWTIPDAISDRVWIRIRDTQSTLMNAVVSDPFKITGGLKLVEPLGSDVWRVGSRHDIVWKTTGTIPKVRIEYSRDGFKKDRRTVVSDLENHGVYTWEVSDAIGEKVWLRISDARDPNVAAGSEQPFKIQGELRLLSPAGGETWQVDTDQEIKWQTVGTIPEVRIELRIPESSIPKRPLAQPVDDQPSDEKPGMPAPAPSALPANLIVQNRISNLGSFVWKIPDNLPPLVYVRLTDVSDASVFSESAYPLKVRGALTLLSPDKKTTWPVGSTQAISWRSSGYMPQVKIEYSRDHFQKDIGTLYPLTPNTGGVKWVVQDLIGSDFQIRISDPENPEVFAVSQQPIDIVGILNLESPKAGEPLEVGSKTEIRWLTVGSIASVKLEFSRDQFVRHSGVITENVANIGRYTWDVPDYIAGNVWLRVSDAGNPKVQAISKAPFSIHGALTLIGPQGGEIFSVRDEAKITWDTVGSIGKVRLEYSTDDFVTSTPMSGPVDNQGLYVWRIPDIVTDRLMIRVYAAQDKQVFGSTRAPIKIQGRLTFQYPQGGEFWKIGAQQLINWETAGSIPYVTLEYSSDNFATAVPVIFGLANKNSFSWTVPDIAAEMIQLRITNAEDQSVFAQTPPLRVGGALELLSPSGGEIWRVGEEQEIRWKTTGTIPRVRLEISTDQFDREVEAIAMSLENNGVYRWRVPDWIRGGLQFRVSDVRNSYVSDVTDAPFKISGSFQLLSPQGGEVWAVGSTQAIKWSTNGTIQNVRLEYSKDNFASVMPIAAQAVNTGYFMWELPDLAGSKIRIRISDPEDSQVRIETPYAVEIQGGLRLTAPAGSEVWPVGSKQLVSWSTSGTIPNVNLEYTTDDFNTTTPIAGSIANTGSYLWTIPDIQSDSVRLRVVHAVNTEISDSTREPLKIQGSLVLTAPRGGETWVVGSQQAMTWESTGKIGNIRLEYSSDDFKSVFPIVSSTPNTGKYVWQIPDDISKNIRVKITSVTDPSVTSESAQASEIIGALRISSPTGGEVWQVGNRYAVLWDTLGTIPQIRLEYSRDDFKSDVNTMASNLANKGIYYWEVPAILGGHLKVRVIDSENNRVFDVSRGTFQIAGVLELLAPNWGEAYSVGERVDIQWRSTPNISQVKLEYSTDEFATSAVISQAAQNSGKFAWNIPDTISDKVLLRVSDAQNAQVYAVSKAPFSIRGALQLETQRQNEIWPIGSDQTILWKTLGTIPEIRIEYSGDGFATSLPVAAKIANTGRFVWTVPEMTQKEIKIRVSDASNMNVQAVSAGLMRVTGTLDLISPVGGEKWAAGEERIIRWQTSGYLPGVILEYSKDDFNKDINLIEAEVHNVGSYFWKVPNDRSAQIKIRVRSQDDADVYSVSKQPFEIGLYKINWVLRDAKTHDHLSGLQMTDSSGKTQAGLTSPVTLEYPYGIFTTAWSKPGFEEFRSTWLADQDRTFTAYMETADAPVESPRVNFEYDRERDIMKITTWFEKDGKPVPAVIYSEIRVYDGPMVLKTLSSSNPDASGYFHMVWDTTNIQGNKRYLASASINTANGKTLTSPISYQIDIPVKAKIIPEPKPRLPAESAKPKDVQKQLAAEAPFWASEPSQTENVSEPLLETLKRTSVTKPVQSARNVESRILAPAQAIMNETLSIQYVADSDVRPAIDIYDANKKLFVRGASMTESRPGEFTFMMPVRGISFIPGKPITVTVVERKTGKFQSLQIMVVSSPSALGLTQQIGDTTVLDLIRRLEALASDIKDYGIGRKDQSALLISFEKTATELAGVISADNLHPMIFDKLNRIAEELARAVKNRGFDGEFLVAEPLRNQSGLSGISMKLRDFQQAVNMLYRAHNVEGVRNRT